jgi:hypothetical protein
MEGTVVMGKLEVMRYSIGFAALRMVSPHIVDMNK